MAGRWAQAAAGTDVALVVVGAWDVFDVVDGDTTYGFATPEGDALFVTNLESGIDAMLAEGTNVGLLEVACMRPQDVEGRVSRRFPSAVTMLVWPHVNDLLRETAASIRPPVTLGCSSSRAPTSGAPTRRSQPTSAIAGTACTSTSRARPGLHHRCSRPAPTRCDLIATRRT